MPTIPRESLPPDDRIISVGHGTLSADDFGALLAGAGVTTLVDVRRYPGSRRFPHFGSSSMLEWLPDHGVAYAAVAALGGRRRPSATAPTVNASWRNPQFRAYADHMASDEFAGGVAELLDTTRRSAGAVAVMCSESVWWRCHRRLLADHLELIEHIPVDHLFHDGRLARHPPSPAARPDGRRVVYPAD